MSHFAALYSLVFMIGFVGLFDLRHTRIRFYRLFTSKALMNADELDLLHRIQLACAEE
jgi:hypothetical protein